jgi:hypothetical protein
VMGRYPRGAATRGGPLPAGGRYPRGAATRGGLLPAGGCYRQGAATRRGLLRGLLPAGGPLPAGGRYPRGAATRGGDGSPSTRFVDAAGLGTETRRPSQPQLRERAATFASASDLPASTPLQCGEATLFDTSWPHAGPPVNVDAPMRNTIFIALTGGSHARRKRTYDAPIYTEAAQKRCDEQNRKLARKE